MTYRGPFCSETSFVPGDHKVEDCVACSGINIVNAAGLHTPTTPPEREALRVDSADTQGGMDHLHLAMGIRKRYGLTVSWFQGQAAIEKALDDGWALSVIGWYESLPSDPWRWQRPGAFYHEMTFLRNDAKSRWRADPLAPANDRGIAMPTGLFRAFAASGNWQAIGLLEGSASATSAPGEPVALPVSNTTPAIIDLPFGKQLYDLGGNPTVLISGAAIGVFSPYEVQRSATSHLRVTTAATGPGGQREMVLIANGDCNPRPVPAPKPTDCTSAIAAEHERTLLQAKAALEAIR